MTSDMAWKLRLHKRTMQTPFYVLPVYGTWKYVFKTGSIVQMDMEMLEQRRMELINSRICSIVIKFVGVRI